MDFAALLRKARQEASEVSSAPALEGLRNSDEAKRRVFSRVNLESSSSGVGLGETCDEDEPVTIAYCADFINEVEGAALEAEVRKRRWEQLAGRKLQNWGGVPHPSGTILETMPPFIDALADRLHLSGVFPDEKPNQALVNLYAPHEGIAPHQDGPTFKPRAAILSLGSPALLCFRDPEDKDKEVLCRIVMEPRSLVVFSGKAFLEWEHWVPATGDIQSIKGAANESLLSEELRTAEEFIRTERISMTMRCVAHVKSRADELDLALNNELKQEVARRHQWWRQAISQKQ